MAIPAGFTLFNKGVVGVGANGQGQVYVYDFKEQLKLAGWSVLASGDGLAAYSSSGDVITSSANGANGINNLAWFRIGNPDGRELCIQCIQGFSAAGSYGCRSKYSGSAGFVTGGSATQVPSASDEGLFAGAGTDAAPTASTGGFIWGDRSDGHLVSTRSIWFGLFETVSPYRFIYVMQYDTWPGTIGGWMMDILDPPYGTTNHNDPDPAVLYQAGRINSSGAPWGIRAVDDLSRVNAAYAPSGAGAHAMIGGQLLPFGCHPPGNTNEIFNQNAGDDFGSNYACAIPMWARYPDSISGGLNGIKGLSTLFGCISYPNDSIGWGAHKLLSFNGEARAFIQINGCYMPWDGTDPYAGTGWVSTVWTQTLKLWQTPDTIGPPSTVINRVIGTPAGLASDIPGGFAIG